MAATLTFVIPCRKRGADLNQVVANIYEQAERPADIYVVAIVDADDPDTLDAARTLSVAYPQGVRTFVNSNVNLGYHGLAQLWDAATVDVSTDLVAQWGDRVYIQTPGYDALLSDAFSAAHPYSIFQLNEENTWNYAYPLVSTRLNQLVRIFKTEAPDAYIRYIAECCDINVPVPSVAIQRVQPTAKYGVRFAVKQEKEKLFRNSPTHKDQLRADVQRICDVVGKSCDQPHHIKWLKLPTIAGGPRFFSTLPMQ
jgi:glycosyltransferase involved in cell wall biosynthesis